MDKEHVEGGEKRSLENNRPENKRKWCIRNEMTGIEKDYSSIQR